MYSQENIKIKGKVLDSDKNPLIGATVVLKNKASYGVTTDIDGVYMFSVPKNSTLIFSYIGMKSKEVKVSGSNRNLVVILENSSTELDEVVVVGYGQQKKASVVGSITQTTGDVLMRSAGVSDVGSTLTGNLPGVITTSSTGMPGEETPNIVIRGISSWNSSSPLVLVDGIEREMKNVDVSSIASVSVLKDASATAVYGVRGANGVILITTKRGSDGKTKINLTCNATMKVPSYLPSKYDSYDALMVRNESIENDLAVCPEYWPSVVPMDIIGKYRNQTTLEQKERYPNVDWQKVMFKDFVMSYNCNMNMSGGGKIIKYFVSADYQNEGDIFEKFNNARNYSTRYSYNRFNVRCNLDFNITKSTVFSANVSGSTGIKRTPWSNQGNTWEIQQRWSGAYQTPPDAFMPIYSDGSFGYYPTNTQVRNPITALVTTGDAYTSTTNITTDFVLNQNLDFITKGLNFKGLISWDNVYLENNRGINDDYNSPLQKWIDPATGESTYYPTYTPTTGLDFNPGNLWSTNGGYVNGDQLVRKLNYQLQLNYTKTYKKHEMTLMGLFSRSENGYGSSIPSYREDWAFRATYNFAHKYFIEYNGAYNGSEKFSKDNRFAFFNSGALGWTISEEKFFKSIKFINMLKFRASYGEIGDDNTSSRWLYMSQWNYGGSTPFYSGQYGGKEYSPYVWYREGKLGNPNVHWETVRKFNMGADFSIFDGLISGSADFFHDKRRDILVDGSSRAIPFYFGAEAPTANLGKMSTKGYEFEIRFNKQINNKTNLWANMNMTHSENKVLTKSEPKLLPAYQKQEGYPLWQNKSYVDAGFINTYDQLYASTKHDINNSLRRPGDYAIIDYNCDGIIDKNDKIPFAYTETPQNTYSLTLGGSYSNWSFSVQFYGVNNVSRNADLRSFSNGSNNVYNLGKTWVKDDSSSKFLVPRTNANYSEYLDGTQFIYDGSYIRLKNIEIAYNLNENLLKKVGVKDLKLYINGNNIWVWSRMPDDRESNFSGGASNGAYPTMKRINLGIKLTL